jgi:hypothetical protein
VGYEKGSLKRKIATGSRRQEILILEKQPGFAKRDEKPGKTEFSGNFPSFRRNAIVNKKL